VGGKELVELKCLLAGLWWGWRKSLGGFLRVSGGTDCRVIG